MHTLAFLVLRQRLREWLCMSLKCLSTLVPGCIPSLVLFPPIKQVSEQRSAPHTNARLGTTCLWQNSLWLCKSNSWTFITNLQLGQYGRAGFEDVLLFVPFSRLAAQRGWGEALCPTKWNSMNIWSAVVALTPTHTHRTNMPLPSSVHPRTPSQV